MGRRRQLLAAFEILTLFLLITIGAFAYAAHSCPFMRQSLTHWLRDEAPLRVFGLGILGVAALFALGLWSLHRGRYLNVKLSSSPAQLSEPFVRTLILRFWEDAFPQISPPIHIGCVNRRLELEMAPLPKTSLAEIEQKLMPFLDHQLGKEVPTSLSIRSSR